MRGINTILITGKILSDSIPIGADTELVSIMTRIFIISTIVARVEVGIKASMAFVLPEPLVRGNIPEPLLLANTPQPLDLGNLPEPLLLANIPEPLDRGNTPKPLGLGNTPEPLLLGNLPESLDLANIPEPRGMGNLPESLDRGNTPKPLVMAARNLKKPDMMRKKSSKGNQRAFSEIR